MSKSLDYSTIVLSADDNFDTVNKLIADMFIVDQTNIEGSSAENVRIFTVLQKLWSIHSRKLKKLHTDVKKVEMQRTRHYLGKLPRSHYDKDPLPEAILKSDVEKYVAIDDIVIEIRTLYQEQEAIVTLIEEAKKMLNQRGWDIRAIIDLRKMQAGAS
ncbi:hypothetical protein [Ralstonia phage RSP15]|uniref:UvsY-like recombination mediator n=1 Tax=Ralstonia phage RSP15 TaxID=1785960 RepID=UPI00074D4A7C|nr:UvsY-like recombination mediator [Ralstonia phage RSP15]BAU39965.1 hypothetical protein [Ralstonia phage RSP15]